MFLTSALRSGKTLAEIGFLTSISRERLGNLIAGAKASAEEREALKAAHHRDVFDRDGIPTGQIPLWRLETVNDWMERVKALGVGR